MAGSKRSLRTTRSRASNPIAYIHPVKLLIGCLEDAIIKANALPYFLDCTNGDPRTYSHKYLDPAHRAIELAQFAACGVGQSLRFGMGDRAGVTETELRADLGTLYVEAYQIYREDLPPFVRRRFWTAYDRLENTWGVLQGIAIEPEPIAWSEKLRQFYSVR